MRKRILSLVIIASLFIINTYIVSACSCLWPLPSPQESLNEYTAVFTGKVTHIDIPSGIVISSADPVMVTFNVSEIWKGPNDKTLIVTTARDGVSCGYSFEQGEEYIVYAYGKEDELITTICSRTNLLAKAQEDLQELGKGKLPTNYSSQTDLQKFGKENLSDNSDSNISYLHQRYNPIQIFYIVLGILFLIVITIVVRKYKE